MIIALEMMELALLNAKIKLLLYELYCIYF